MSAMLLALACAALAHASARAAPVRIDRAVIVEQGVLAVEIEIDSSRVTRGKASDGRDVSDELHKYIPPRTMRPVSEVLGALGTDFGYRFKLVGKPDGAPVKLDFVTLYPPPGMKDEKTGKFARTSVAKSSVRIGQETYFLIEFKDEADIIPGTWVLEVRAGKRTLARVSFRVSRSRPPKPVRLGPNFHSKGRFKVPARG